MKFKPQIQDDSSQPIQTELFIVNMLEWAVKDDLGSMEHPIFGIQKSRSTEIQEYRHNGVVINIIPSIIGPATIWDKDLLIFAASALVEGEKRGLILSREIVIDMADFLEAVKRGDGGASYTRILDMLRRLKGTYIETNLNPQHAPSAKHVQCDTDTLKSFSLLADYSITKKSKSGRVVQIKIILSEWLYNCIVEHEILTINRDYFALSGGLERRFYELARKFVGTKKAYWKCNINAFVNKVKIGSESGSGAQIRHLRSSIRAMIKEDPLPDYHIALDTKTHDGVDDVVFYTRNSRMLHQDLISNNLASWFTRLERTGM